MPFEVALLHKIRWRLDLTSALIVASFTFCFAVRLVVSALCLDPESCDGLVAMNDKVVIALKILNSFVDKLKWLIVYFCVLELQEVRVKVESESVEEYQKKVRALVRVKWFMVAFFILVQIPSVFVSYLGSKVDKLLDEVELDNY